MRNLLLTIAYLLLASGPVFAQRLSGETEVGSDGKGEGFFSQYLFYDTKNANILTRYSYVNGVLQRGEFAIGPTFKLSNSNILKLDFGGTTDKEVMIGDTLIAKIRGQELLFLWCVPKLFYPNAPVRSFFVFYHSPYSHTYISVSVWVPAFYNAGDSGIVGV